MYKLSIGLLFVAVTTGCSTQSFIVNDQAGPTPTKEIMQPFFISGLGQTQEVDAAEVCNGAENVAKVETHMSFLDGLLGTLSSGVYTPRQATVYCVVAQR